MNFGDCWLIHQAIQNYFIYKNRSIFNHIMDEWIGEKARIIETWGYKLWYTGRDKNRNGVGVIINKHLLENVVEVRRKGDRILLVLSLIHI